MTDIHYFEIKTSNGKAFKATIEKTSNGDFIGSIAPTNLNQKYIPNSTYTNATRPGRAETVFNEMLSKITKLLVEIDPIDSIKIVDNAQPLFVNIVEQRRILGTNVEIMIDGAQIPPIAK